MASAAKQYKTLIVWMRRDLRIADNAALYHALQAADHVIPLFVLDSDILSRPDTGDARVVFLLDALKHLDANLQNLESRLIIRFGPAHRTVPEAAVEFQADGVFFHREYEPFGRNRDLQVIKALGVLGKACETFKDLVLCEPDEIRSKTGSPYTVYSPYKRAWMEFPFERPYPAPQRISMPHHVHGADPAEAARHVTAHTKQEFSCGGEDAARKLLDDFIARKVTRYVSARDLPAEDGTSLLSRHLHFGTISPRTVVSEIRRAGVPNTAQNGAASFIGEMAWREFYIQILFHHPQVVESAFRPQYDLLEWENDEGLLNAWKQGRTGYPIVDAAMRQMNQTAWMHNRARMITASFLTKDLLVDWRAGERYFMQQLVDGDQAANNGGWQWTAGTGTDAQPFFRIFNPVSQGKKFDPEGVYVKRWVPELSQVPPAYIHRPWELSEAERAYLKCEHYPPPIVDHQQRRSMALSLYGRVSRGKQR